MPISKGTGIATVTFTGTSGNNSVELFVSDVTVPAGASIGFFETSDVTSDNNSEMHAIADIKYSLKSITPGSGFTLVAYSPHRIRGQFKVRYSWAYNG